MNPAKKGLGRGLSALFGDIENKSESKKIHQDPQTSTRKSLRIKENQRTSAKIHQNPPKPTKNHRESQKIKENPPKSTSNH